MQHLLSRLLPPMDRSALDPNSTVPHRWSNYKPRWCCCPCKRAIWL